MLTGFYGAFSPACLALLGLWLVVVQVRMREWQGSAIHRRRSYGVALIFALPGVMSLLALIDPQDPDYWRVSFAIIALGGAVALAAVRGFLSAGNALRPEQLGSHCRTGWAWPPTSPGSLCSP
jgi:peptidoglycan/LPS O-acetylase OafA/YrhL